MAPTTYGLPPPVPPLEPLPLEPLPLVLPPPMLPDVPPFEEDAPLPGEDASPELLPLDVAGA
ncbi:MAG: hypothetical protein ACYCVY_04755 [Acidiferrobacteraceae bacterium]